MARGTGARGLRMILEEVMLNIMYEIPSQKDIKQCKVTAEVVERRLDPEIVYIRDMKAKKSHKETA